MATATSRRAAPAPKVLKERRALAHELLGIHVKLAPQFAQMDVLETKLKAIATAAGDSFEETWADLGKVSVAPGHAAEFKGDVPQVVTEAWQALSPAKRKALVASGVIKIEPQWGKKSSGRVTPKVFGETP